MSETRERRPRQEPVVAPSGAPRPGASGGYRAAPRVRLFVPSAGWGGRGRRELLLGAGGLAVLFHLAMLGAIVEAPALLPGFLRTPPLHPPPPPPEAELVMVKQDTPTVGGALDRNDRDHLPPADDDAARRELPGRFSRHSRRDGRAHGP